jgi:hypothetical protein
MSSFLHLNMWLQSVFIVPRNPLHPPVSSLFSYYSFLASLYSYSSLSQCTKRVLLSQMDSRLKEMIATCTEEQGWLSRYSDGLRQGQDIFLYSTASRPALKPT